MSNTKAVVRFGSTNFSVYSNGLLLLSRPSALIIKKSLRPTVVCSGEDALERSEQIRDDELFIRPIKRGAIAHYEGVRLLIREYLHSIFGFVTDIELCVLISCGLDAEQKKEIESAFVGCGYTNVYLMENLLALSEAARLKDMDVVAYFGGDLTEIGIVKNHSIVSGYSLDVGGNTIINKLTEKINDKYKIYLSCVEAIRVAETLATLYKNDLSVAEATGTDIITGRPKKLSLSVGDVREEVNYVFTRILKLMNGALTVAPVSVIERAVSKGILISGEASKINGLEEFIYSSLSLPCVIEPSAALASAYQLINLDGGKWVENEYLKL